MKGKAVPLVKNYLNQVWAVTVVQDMFLLLNSLCCLCLWLQQTWTLVLAQLEPLRIFQFALCPLISGILRPSFLSGNWTQPITIFNILSKLITNAHVIGTHSNQFCFLPYHSVLEQPGIWNRLKSFIVNLETLLKSYNSSPDCGTDYRKLETLASKVTYSCIWEAIWNVNRNSART